MAQPATYGYQQPATGFHRVIIVGLEAHKPYAEERRHRALGLPDLGVIRAEGEAVDMQREAALKLHGC